MTQVSKICDVMKENNNVNSKFQELSSSKLNFQTPETLSSSCTPPLTLARFSENKTVRLLKFVYEYLFKQPMINRTKRAR